jgi:hypothetical protein
MSRLYVWVAIEVDDKPEMSIESFTKYVGSMIAEGGGELVKCSTVFGEEA